MTGNHFMVDPGNDKLIIFDLSPDGLYYYKITEDTLYTFIALEMVGCPSEQDLEKSYMHI